MCIRDRSEAGRAVLVRRAMDEMMDKVVYYSRQRRSAAFCQKAVSYTHLDVYKRQPRTGGQ